MIVLAMVAHPDDEVLGAGGTLAKHAKSGDTVCIAYLSTGVGARLNIKQEVQHRMGMARKAADILGASIWLNDFFPDNQMDSVPLLSIVRVVEGYIDKIKPNVIYTHHGGDLNIDHRICQQAVLTACRPMQGSSVKAIYAMEVASSTEWAAPSTFHPNRFVDISSTVELKQKAMHAYGEEMREYPHPRSFQAIYALGRWRGATAGLEHAEAFMVLREIT